MSCPSCRLPPACADGGSFAAGPNRRLRYSLLGDAGGCFSVDGQSGLVRLERPLERGQRFELAVEARDAGTPPLTARVPLTLLVQSGGGAPEFTQQAYSVVVSEAAPLGSPVDAGLRALSRDPSARISYALVAGNERAHFSIEPTTGWRCCCGKGWGGTRYSLGQSCREGVRQRRVQRGLVQCMLCHSRRLWSRLCRASHAWGPWGHIEGSFQSVTEISSHAKFHHSSLRP